MVAEFLQSLWQSLRFIHIYTYTYVHSYVLYVLINNIGRACASSAKMSWSHAGIKSITKVLSEFLLVRKSDELQTSGRGIATLGCE